MSALQLIGSEDVLIATDEHFVVDIIDLLRDEAGDPLFIWSGTTWNTPAGESRSALRLEAADPRAILTVRFVGQTPEAPPSGESVWSGRSTLYFRRSPGEALDLVAADSAEAPGELLARLERDRGIWRVAAANGRFEKLYFSALAPPRPAEGPRQRLSPLAG